MSQDIEHRVIDLAAEQVGADPAMVTLQHHFENDLNYDSLDRVEFAMQVEEEFEIHVDDDEMNAIRNVGDVVELIKRARTTAGVAG